MKYTIAKYAERVGVSRAYLYKLIKQKKIDLFLNGKKKEIDSDQVDPIVKYKEAGRATTKTYQKNGAKRKGKNTSTGSGEDKTELPELNSKTSLEDLERITAFEKAKKGRIDNEIKGKGLVDFNQTSDTVFNFLRPLRDDLLEVAKRLSPIIFMSKSKLETEKILNKEIDRIMLSRVGNDYKFNEALKKKVIKVLRM